MRLCLFALLFVFAMTRVARAQSASAEAEALFRQGVALMDAGLITEACTAFDGSQQRWPAITTLLNQATCREKSGQFATAWGLYVEAERQTRGSPDPTARTLHQVAQDHATKLEPRLSRLTVNVVAKDPVVGLEITRGTEVIARAAWGRTLPVDGGNYTINAHAPGCVPWKTTVDIDSESDNKVVEVPALRQVTAAAKTPRSMTLPLVLAGSAVILLGGGFAFELSAESTYGKYKAVRGKSPLFDSANRKRYIAEGFAASAITCAIAGAWLYFRDAGHEFSAGRRVAIEPLVGTDRAGLQVSGHY